MLKKIEFTQEQLQTMIKMHDAGFLNREIADYIGTSTSTVNRRLCAMNVQSRHPSLSQERKVRAVELYKEYGIMSHVAKELHMNSETVRQILIEHNVTIRTSSEVAMSYEYDVHYFDEINTNNKAYYLGLFGSDGSVSSNHNVISISLQEEDKYLLESFMTEIGYGGSLRYIDRSKKNKNWKNAYGLSISNKTLRDGLISKGVVPRKSYCYQFPDFLEDKYYSHYI